MLFTSITFACGFLPVVLAVFFLVARFSTFAAAAWLFTASVIFYGYWMPEFTLLLLASIAGNFWIGGKISTSAMTDETNPSRISRRWMVLGVTTNLALLSYFKYANFFIDNLTAAFGVHWDIGRVVLPIGISFFTFTQIAYLVDTWRKEVREYRWVHYGLFVTYFPHLIAGPVLHHAQMMPQFKDAATYRFQAANFTAGLGIFALGLFKKIVLADGVAPYADAAFKAADAGIAPDFQEAWLGALAYTLQLYFDFSGYSDMAIGLSWMMNVRLPFNFNSPYQSVNISEFWRRWHMTLSQFLRDYLYIGLGGNRKGTVRRYANLMTTMVLGGLWHGASWSFVVWGFLHGMYLVAHQGFRWVCGTNRCAQLDASRTFSLAAWLLTTLAVVLAWVVFRAETLSGAGRMLNSMLNPFSVSPVHTLLWNAGLNLQTGALWCAVLGAAATVGPNSNSLGQRLRELCQARTGQRALISGAAFAVVAFLLTVNAARDSASAFIYFNF